MKKRNAFAVLLLPVLLFLFGCTLAGNDNENENPNPNPQLKVVSNSSQLRK